MKSGILDQIVEADSRKRQIVPMNAAVFTEGQLLQVWTKLDGTFRGACKIQKVIQARRPADVSYLEVDNVPVGTGRGDLLIYDSDYDSMPIMYAALSPETENRLQSIEERLAALEVKH
jgi:hypothetical protein